MMNDDERAPVGCALPVAAGVALGAAVVLGLAITVARPVLELIGTVLAMTGTGP